MEGQTDDQTDWSRPVELKLTNQNAKSKHSLMQFFSMTAFLKSKTIMLNNEIKVCSLLKQPISHMNLCSGTLNMR